ncbi:MFS transporter [Palleronia caenipelagi]|uniref:MFS transporter n=1 Tax=Palleronia caenipelagi TaxID=2489174 RepID=UPI00163DCD63|nr:MFS transporter [Palleronia caenipelagi]
MTQFTRHLPLQPTTFAIGFLFFVNGIVFAAWATNIPFIQERYDLSEAQIGTVLLVIAAGAVVFMSMTSLFVRQFGSRLVSMVATQLFAAALAVAFYVESLTGLFLSVILLGAANGSMDVAMNQQAALYEAKQRRPIMSRLHGCFSIGALIGALTTYFAASVGVEPFQQAAAISLIVLGIGALLYSSLLADPTSVQNPKNGFSIELAKHRKLVLLGSLSCLAMMSEGAIADWSTLFLIEYSGLEAGTAALGFGTYALLMIVGRFSGDNLTSKIGYRVLGRLSGVLTCIGILLLLFGGTIPLQFFGFALLGFGIANLVPVVFSNAARLKSINPGAGIAFVSVAGYSGFLIGPAVIGWLAEHVGLDKSLLVVLAAGLVFVLSSRILPAKP